MKKNVKIMALALSAAMALSMAGCGSSGSQDAGTTAAAKEESTAAEAGSEESGDSAKAAPEGATVFKLGTTVNEQDSFQVAAEKFAELVAERTNGAYAIEIYPNGTLGGERDMLESMQIGTLDMGIITSGPFINFSSAMGVLDMPYLFASNEEAYAVLDGEIGRELLDTLEDSGLKGLAYAERGFRNLTNSVKPIQTAADLSGMTIRIMENDVYTASFQAMNVNATPMAWADALTALQQGTVQGQENPINVIYSYSLWESQKYVTLDRHSYSTAIITMSASLFDSLDADTQQIFLDAAQEAAEYERAWVADQESSQLQALKDNGMEVIEEPDLASFKEAVQPVYDQYSEYSDYVSRIQEVIANME
ncbi:DctP family TRAP transporter solute-binding subunit [Clostridiaceae bacterium]|nr:DctP family TRAP transporter solute-binding subunit [Clostridiaceae bacterium]RKI11838.1 DctP family TRAP transporter solute-binding subunit [bacterium 1XD21-70]